MIKTLLLMLTLLVLNFTNAHAYLEHSNPSQAETVKVLDTIMLEFSESVQTQFSFFKVYKLSDTGNLDDPQEYQQLHSQALELVTKVIPKRNDQAERADLGITSQNTIGTSVTLKIKENLSSGIYVVMWRVLSVDTHTTQGYFLLNYVP